MTRDVKPFRLEGLPLELRQLVYHFADLKTAAALQSNHLLDYISSTEIHAAPSLLNVSRKLRAESFPVVVEQNVVDITDVAYIHPLIDDYLKESQADMNLWCHIRMARINYDAVFITTDSLPSDFTRQILGILQQCKHVERVEFYVSSDALRKQKDGCLDVSGVADVLASLPALKEIHICWSLPKLSNTLSMRLYGLYLDWLENISLKLHTQMAEGNCSAAVELHGL